MPIYLQLKELLQKEIDGGKPGSRLPSERELAKRWRISRMTVRAAIEALIDEDYLQRVPGRGTFAVRPKLQQPLLTLTSFTEDMRARGLRPQSAVLDLVQIPSPAAVASQLRVDAGHPVVKLRRLRLADGEPMSVEVAYLDAVRCAFLFGEDLARHSLYEVLAGHGIDLAWAAQFVGARRATAEEAGLLRIPRGASVLETHRTTYDRSDSPVEHVRSVYRADRYAFNVTLFRSRRRRPWLSSTSSSLSRRRR